MLDELLYDYQPYAEESIFGPPEFGSLNDELYWDGLDELDLLDHNYDPDTPWSETYAVL